jgi:sec-independent protein translocase protein TatA
MFVLNNIGLPGLLLVAMVIILLFGRGKISALMGDVGKGITAFRRGIRSEPAPEPQPSVTRAKSASDQEKSA